MPTGQSGVQQAGILDPISFLHDSANHGSQGGQGGLLVAAGGRSAGSQVAVRTARELDVHAIVALAYPPDANHTFGSRRVRAQTMKTLTDAVVNWFERQEP
jgi:hypothetical protein